MDSASLLACWRNFVRRIPTTQEFAVATRTEKNGETAGAFAFTAAMNNRVDCSPPPRQGVVAREISAKYLRAPYARYRREILTREGGGNFPDDFREP